MTILNFSDRPTLSARDVCIVGAGPIGIALAFACEANGLSVLLLESGNLRPNAVSGALSGATMASPESHAAMEVAVCRALGGTTHWWGGRCVAFDDVDFVPRSQVTGAEWPLAHEEIRRWYSASASFLRCGPAEFSKPLSGNYASGNISCDSVERWVPDTNLATVYRARLEKSEKICVVLGATVTRLNFTGQNQIESIVVADTSGAESIKLNTCVVACGGLETTRLLLVAQRERPEMFGGRDGALGRYYMGHISGKLADLQFDNPAEASRYDFFRDGQVFVRRRFTLKTSALERERLLNIAFWIDNPAFYDPGHENGVLSLVWLALATPVVGRRLLSEAVRLSHVGPPPRRFLDHVRNVLAHMGPTAVALGKIVRDRYLRVPRKPGFLLNSKSGRYALHYHAQQMASPFSRVALADQTDALGVPRLLVDFTFCTKDAESVVKAHEILDEDLRTMRIGRLVYRVDAPTRLDFVAGQAADGFHQMGTTKMGVSPGTSVVDPNCQVHGVNNLFVASTSVFPTSGQANPTFLGAAMAFRLGAFLCSRAGQTVHAVNRVERSHVSRASVTDAT